MAVHAHVTVSLSDRYHVTSAWRFKVESENREMQGRARRKGHM